MNGTLSTGEFPMLPSRADQDYIHHIKHSDDDETLGACSTRSVPSGFSRDPQQDGHFTSRDVAGRAFNNLNPLCFLPAGMYTP